MNPRAPSAPAPPASYMQAAIQMALDGVAVGQGGPFGAVVVRGGEIIGRGANQVLATRDPTAHAEIVAIRAACQALGAFHLPDCELYTTCEPCPMCLAAIYWARLPRFYFACTAADAAAIGFSDAEICGQLALPPERRSVSAVPLLREAALAAFAAWQAKSDRVMY